jgi:cytochrome c-type biogenesis protein CcsB
MVFTSLENFLRNLSFISIFSTMLFFWIKAGFFYTKKTNNVENFLLLVCNLSLISILVIRWIDAQHFPLSNLYESLLFLSWSLLSFLLILQIKTKEYFLGIILTPIILFINTFATFSLPIEMQKSSSLVPALQSNWLMMHVTIMMLSYAALICGSLLGITFLVLYNNLKKDSYNQFLQSSTTSNNTSVLISNSSVEKNCTGSSSSYQKELSFKDECPTELNQSFSKNVILINKLDNLSYRTIGIGFPLLTIGILSGAVWANETWGSYWSWDPKETWAFITWLVYAIYLHSRIIKGWEGEKPALIASFGFLMVWVCYLGVNIFGKGLHSYGWFENI